MKNEKEKLEKDLENAQMKLSQTVKKNKVEDKS